jgi:hypothetical protein
MQRVGTSSASLERERSQAGPIYASWPMHSCDNTAIKGWSWPSFWANLASFSLVGGSGRRDGGGLACLAMGGNVIFILPGIFHY